MYSQGGGAVVVLWVFEMNAVTPKRRLFIVIPTHWSDRIGGSQLQMYFISQHPPIQEYFDIRFVCRRFTTAQHEQIGIYSVKSKFLRGGLALIEESIRLLTLLLREKPDVVMQTVSCVYTGVVGLYGRINPKCLTVWRAASDKTFESEKFSLRNIHHFFENMMVDMGIRRFKRIVVQSHIQNNLLMQKYGRTADRVISNYQPGDVEEVEKPVGKWRVVWIANIKKIKQPEVFINMCSQFQNRTELEFVMIGRLPDSKRYQNEIRALLDSTSNIEFLGPLSLEKANIELSRSHVLVNTSEYEGMSNTFIQAWMRSVPVVTLTADPDNIIRDQCLGISCKNQCETLVQTISELPVNDKSFVEMGVRARNYAVSAHGESVLNDYTDVLTGIDKEKAGAVVVNL